MPTLSELRDVLDWQAVTVLREIDERDRGEGATVDTLVAATEFDRDAVETRLQQLEAVGLVAGRDREDGTLYEVTGAGHGAIGAGLYETYDFVGEPDVDALAERVADLLDRRDELETAVAELRADAHAAREQAERHFGDREDVTAEVESLLRDVESLAETLER